MTAVIFHSPFHALGSRRQTAASHRTADSFLFGHEFGLRHPASASCLGRHLRLAGRCPNNSSLFPPLAAVVVVALWASSAENSIIICGSETSADASEPLFHGRGCEGKQYRTPQRRASEGSGTANAVCIATLLVKMAERNARRRSVLPKSKLFFP